MFNKKKILFFAPSIEEGGVEKNLFIVSNFIANDKNYKVVVVTNQSGVARGFFTIKDVYKIHSYIQKKLKENGAKIDAFYFCPFHKD